MINKCVYNVHPVYDLYASSKDGKIIHIIKQEPHKGNKTRRGYLNVCVRKHGQSGFKGYQVHRFVWECFNGIMPEGKVIDHINNDKEDNRLCNLKLMTQQLNCKKAAKDRDYTFTAKNYGNRKCVKAAHKNTDEVTYFNSLYAVQQHLSINAGIVNMVCEGLNNCKSGVSKKNRHSYTFEYVKQDDLPVNYHKSANIRPRRVSDEEKNKHRAEWLNMEYKCPECDKTIKNQSKCPHKKHCQKSQKQ